MAHIQKFIKRMDYLHDCFVGKKINSFLIEKTSPICVFRMTQHSNLRGHITGHIRIHTYSAL